MFPGHQPSHGQFSRMTQPVIGLLGHKQSGKDTLASFLVQDHGYRRVAFADVLKEVAYDLNPWVEVDEGGFWRLATLVDLGSWDDAKQEPDVRRFLQDLGVTIRQRDSEFWVSQVEAQLPRADRPIVITDVRFINEADMIASWYGATARVVRDTADREAQRDPHVSEHELDNWSVDYTIDNNGTLQSLRSAAAGLAAAAKAHAGLVV